jgi:MFS family permease
MLAIFAPLGALLLAVGIFCLGHGMLGTLVTLRLVAEGFAPFLVGVVVSGFFGGLVVGALACPILIHRVGHIRAFAGFAAMLAVATLALPLVVEPAAWAPLRFLYGASFAGLTMSIESWLNAVSPNRWRGRVLASYMILYYGAIGGGQLLLNLYGIKGGALFELGALLLALSIVPVALSRVSAPVLEVPKRRSLGNLIAVSPLAVVGSFGTGLVLSAFYGLTPVFGQSLGLGTREISYLMAVTILGGLALQWPIGLVTDLVGRRIVIIAVATVLAAASLAIAVLGGMGFEPLLLLLAAFGGASFTLYPLCLAHSADFLEETEDFVSVSSGMLLAFAVGAVLGPLIAGQAIELANAPGLFLFTAAVGSAIALFGLWRTTQRATIPLEEQEAYVPVPRSTPAVFALDPRAGAGEEDDAESADAPGPDEQPPEDGRLD